MTERYPSRIRRIMRSDTFHNVVEALRSGGVSTIFAERPRGLPLSQDPKLGLGTRQKKIDGDK